MRWNSLAQIAKLPMVCRAMLTKSVPADPNPTQIIDEIAEMKQAIKAKERELAAVEGQLGITPLKKISASVNNTWENVKESETWAKDACALLVNLALFFPSLQPPHFPFILPEWAAAWRRQERRCQQQQPRLAKRSDLWDNRLQSKWKRSSMSAPPRAPGIVGRTVCKATRVLTFAVVLGHGHHRPAPVPHSTLTPACT